MANVKTDVHYFKDDIGKNLYRQKTYYTVVVEQDVLANSKDEANDKIREGGGINYSKINNEIVHNNDGVETYVVDANYTETGDTQFIGKVKWDTDSYNQTLEEAKENLDIHIDTWAAENEPNQVDTGTKEESDVDVALNLQAESQRGK